MIETLIMFLLRFFGFRCRVCGEATIERDKFGNLKCTACQFEAEITLSQSGKAA